MYKYIINKLTHQIVQMNLKYDTGIPFPIVIIYFCLYLIPLNLTYVLWKSYEGMET